MKIVIDVDEELVCEGFERQFTEEERAILIRAIGNGIPLPKGHGDLIDKKVAYRKFYNRCYAKVAEEVFSEVPIIIPADK